MTPGAPMPMPRRGDRSSARRASTSWKTSSTAASPLRPSRGRWIERRISPRRFTTAPLNASPRSSPIRWRPSGATRRRMGDLPPLDWPRPTSSIRPSSMSVPTRSPTEVRVRPVSRARSAREQRTVIVERAQHQLLVERSHLLVRRLFGQHRRAGVHPDGHSSNRNPRSLPNEIFGKRLDKVGWCERQGALSSSWTNSGSSSLPGRRCATRASGDPWILSFHATRISRTIRLG